MNLFKDLLWHVKCTQDELRVIKKSLIDFKKDDFFYSCDIADGKKYNRWKHIKCFLFGHKRVIDTTIRIESDLAHARLLICKDCCNLIADTRIFGE